MSRPTAKTELFARYLAEGMAQGDAYVKAGFRPKNKASAQASASRLVKTNPGIAKRRDELIAQRQAVQDQVLAQAGAKIVSEFSLSRDEVLTKMNAIYDMGTAAIPVLDNKGVPTGEYRTNLQAAAGAMRLIGQELHGMFIEKKEVRTGKLEDLSDAELDQKIAEEAAKLGWTIKAGRPMH